MHILVIADIFAMQIKVEAARATAMRSYVSTLLAFIDDFQHKQFLLE